MATFVVCTQCGQIQEITGIDQIPHDWRGTSDDLRCARCFANKHVSAEDVLDEEVIYPSGTKADAVDDIFNEDSCEVCSGPCQGH